MGGITDAPGNVFFRVPLQAVKGMRCIPLWDIRDASPTPSPTGCGQSRHLQWGKHTDLAENAAPEGVEGGPCSRGGGPPAPWVHSHAGKDPVACPLSGPSPHPLAPWLPGRYTWSCCRRRSMMVSRMSHVTAWSSRRYFLISLVMDSTIS